MRSGEWMRPSANPRGFTIIELMVVLGIIGILLTLAAPRYLGGIDISKEAVLKENLATMRDCIDKYYADQGRYPDVLEDLVTKNYLRRIPIDPFTESARSWIAVPPVDRTKGGVYDVRSSAPGKARDGTWFQDW